MEKGQVLWPNDIKLTRSGGRREPCRSREGGGGVSAWIVTAGAVGCSALLGVGEIDWNRALVNNAIGFAVGFIAVSLLFAVLPYRGGDSLGLLVELPAKRVAGGGISDTGFLQKAKHLRVRILLGCELLLQKCLLKCKLLRQKYLLEAEVEKSTKQGAKCPSGNS
ncbi:MAG TPA: hypothetical protein VGO11_25380 [Chthoniobacteraceae bacterium]|jgi:hypothetical protein|nr:hypothetical protein [Chthoniobacteraceae bacterium]